MQRVGGNGRTGTSDQPQAAGVHRGPVRQERKQLGKAQSIAADVPGQRIGIIAQRRRRIGLRIVGGKHTGRALLSAGQEAGQVDCCSIGVTGLGISGRNIGISCNLAAIAANAAVHLQSHIIDAIAAA